MLQPRLDGGDGSLARVPGNGAVMSRDTHREAQLPPGPLSRHLRNQQICSRWIRPDDSGLAQYTGGHDPN